jgi:hypothetical protein
MMDGRIGGAPPMGCQRDMRWHAVMARRSRDRVTLDLCGIGDAARAAAQANGATLAIFARQALIAALPSNVGALLPQAKLRGEVGGTIKLSVRLSPDDSAVLATQAAMLGLSQARLVALLIRRAELPRRSIERDADRAALRASTEQLAALSVDLQQFMRLLRRGSSEGAARCAERLQTVDLDLRTHLSRASAFLAVAHRGTAP